MLPKNLKLCGKSHYRFFGAFTKVLKATISFVMFVCLSVRPSAWNNSVPTGPIFMKFYILVFFENLSRNYNFPYNLRLITDTLHEDLCMFVTISRLILLLLRNAV